MTLSPNSPYSRELAVAQEAVSKASALCRNVQSSIDPGTLEKEDRSPVTVADFGSQAVVCRTLRKAFPIDPIVAEENADALRRPEQEAILADVCSWVASTLPDEEVTDDAICNWIDAGNAKGKAGRFWALDPIDGTKGFLRGDQYAVALALIEDGEVQVAVLGCPNLAPQSGDGAGSLLWAVRGDGAWEAPMARQPKGDPGSTAGMTSVVNVSDNTRGSDARLTESVESRHSSHSEAAVVAERLGIQSEPLRLDSQVKYAVVARGEAEIYLRLLTVDSYKEKIWDHAAGALLVSEAGGKVTDRRSRPLDFTAGIHLGPHDDVVVTNGKLHDSVLQALAE